MIPPRPIDISTHSTACHSDETVSENDLNVKSTILDLCHRVEAVAQAWKCALENNDDESEVVCEQALDKLCAISDELAQCKAARLEEVAVKVNVWKILAPEEVVGGETDLPDTKLLLSVIDDIERLAGAS